MINKYEMNGIKFGVFHGDKMGINSELTGLKSLLAQKYCEIYHKGMVTCGSRFSIQVLMFAKVCTHLNIPIIVFIPTGKDTDMIIELRKTNAQIERVKPGHNTVLNARARSKADEMGYGFIPLGMMEETAFNTIGDIIESRVESFKGFSRVVIPVGSGTTLIGVVNGLKRAKINIPIVGIMVGMDASKNISKNIDGYNIKLIKSKVSYDTEVDGGETLKLNKIYEAKCLEYIKDNDLLFVVSE